MQCTKFFGGTLEMAAHGLYGARMRIIARVVLTGLLLISPLLARGATALETQTAQATARLQDLYRQQERSARPTQFDAAIARERTAMRQLFAKDLDAFINPTQDTSKPEQTADERSALAKQQTLVRALEQRVSEAKVDIDLLHKEDRTIYGQSVQFGTGAVRLTSSRPELLARVAVLEEEVAAIEQVLPAQQERLDKLRTEQRLEQFSLVISIGKYLLGILFVIACERMLRLRLLPRMIPDQGRRYALAKTLATVVYGTLAIFLIVRLTADYPGFLTSFAIIGAALAVALQDVVKDILSWMLTLQGRRYQLGDRIAVGPWTGDVIDISPMRTMLLEVTVRDGRDMGRTGRTVAVPNALTLTLPLVNYNTTSDFVRIEQEVLITYQSDWKRAKEILLQILEEKTAQYAEAANRQEQRRMLHFFVHDELRGPSIYMDLAGSGVLFMMRYTCPVGLHRMLTSHINELILERFAAENLPIDIAYNTSRVYATTLDQTAPPLGSLKPSDKKG